MKTYKNLLILLVIFLILGGFIKFLPYIMLLIVVSYVLKPIKFILIKIKRVFITEKQFESKPGYIYKQCSYCDKKADRTAKKCNNCGRNL